MAVCTDRTHTFVKDVWEKSVIPSRPDCALSRPCCAHRVHQLLSRAAQHSRRTFAFQTSLQSSIRSTSRTVCGRAKRCALPDGELGFEHTGLQERAVALFVEWVKAQAVPGLSCEVVQLAGRTPLIFCEIAADAGSVSTDTVSLCLGAVSDRGGRLAAIKRGLARVRAQGAFLQMSWGGHFVGGSGSDPMIRIGICARC
jgi:hypothetical protein